MNEHNFSFVHAVVCTVRICQRTSQPATAVDVDLKRRNASN